MLSKRWRFVSAAGVGALGLAALGTLLAGRGAPGELGRVNWFRDLPAAREEARRTGRPVMVLNTAAGGEAGRRFGADALSHPIVIDAACEFVAVTSAGTGAAPVVRFYSRSQTELAAGGTDDLSTARLLARMTESLRAAGRPVPGWLQLVTTEYNPPPAKQTASFTVGCFWKGEKELGRLDGVLAARSGMVGREEVVEVDFDPAVLPFGDLARSAAGMSCFQKVNARSDEQRQQAAEVVTAAGGDPATQVLRSDAKADTSGANTQQQYYLSLHPTYHFLPLTSLQATKVNAALVRGEQPDPFLSPSQIALHRRLARLVEKDKRALYGLERSLKPDRSPQGLPAYAADIERRVSAME